MSSSRTGLVIAALVACTACSAHPSDTPPLGYVDRPFIPSDAGGSSTVTMDAGGSADDGGSSAGASVEAEAGSPCDGVIQRSQNVAEYRQIFQLPAPMGGTIARGTYVLSEVTSYASPDASVPDMPPSMPTGALVHATIYVSGATMQFVEARGVDDGDGGSFPSDSVHAETYSASASMLSFTQLCPAAGTQSSMPYTATTNGLTLFVSSSEYEGFHRVP